MAFQIDHLITVTTEREAVRAALAHMGFELSARGEHPGRGTSNHLMFFDRCYWELLSVDEPGPANTMLLGKPTTLVGCALRSSDAARDAAAAARLGADPGTLEAVTRPVRIDGQWHTARFTIAPLTAPAAADVHFFLCQHLTPQLVWPPQPTEHPNGAFRLKALQVIGPTRESAERGIGPLLGAGGNGEPQIEYLSVDACRSRFGGQSPLPSDERLRLAGITFQVRDLERCAAHLSKQRVPHRRDLREIQLHSELVGHPIAFAL
ncbi:MAG TPA: VOC family protein [Steroidobacteraceae bacterium]